MGKEGDESHAAVGGLGSCPPKFGSDWGRVV